MEKYIRTRIINKHASESDWDNSSYVPDAGELIIYDADEQHPCQRFKIGDGNTVVKELVFLSNNPVFVGTTEEYNISYESGLIKEGTVVYLTDDEENVWDEIDLQTKLIDEIHIVLDSKEAL